MTRSKRRGSRSSADRKSGEPAPEIVPPRDLRVSKLRHATEELVVLSYPLASHSLPEVLTRAEREVTLALMAGQSYAEIAARRGTAIRTVANHVASIFRKLGVRSRLELAVRLRDGRRR